ncbi:hypothetical protein [Phascolarctobacterium sp.]|uniref:hypothetical protein n=1 Tax=Phascolarctobacterium sp. TaxID=2049039 RepID=UPI00386BA880
MFRYLKIFSFIMITILLIPAIASAANYIGNSNTAKFHDEGCRHANKIKAGNKVVFPSKQEAVNKGYKPCGVCRP